MTMKLQGVEESVQEVTDPFTLHGPQLETYLMEHPDEVTSELYMRATSEHVMAIINRPWPFFNNFIHVLPQSPFRKQMEQSPGYGVRHEEHLTKNTDPSSLRIKQSNEEFYEIVDRVIKECGLWEFVSGLSEDDIVLGRSTELELRLIPLYRRLRKMGYSHHDLIR